MLDPFGGAVRAPQRDRSTRADARDAFDALTETIWRLRQPDGCPWDREQTHQSIAQNMIEEAYEAVDCIEAGDAAHLREELGDVLMQVMLHAQIAADAHAFTIEDVVRELNEKLIRRHPHVFGPRRGAANAGEVLDIWDQVKKDERTQAGEGVSRPEGLLESVPQAFPALMQAQKVSKRAAKVGFEWDSVDAVWDEVASERAEFEAEEPGSAARELEFGDMLFALVKRGAQRGHRCRARAPGLDGQVPSAVGRHRGGRVCRGHPRREPHYRAAERHVGRCEGGRALRGRGRGVGIP